jgi:hypothetical protein
MPERMERFFMFGFLMLIVLTGVAKGQSLDTLTRQQLEKHFYKTFLAEQEDTPGYSTVVYGLIHFSPAGTVDSFFVSTGDRYGVMLRKAIQTIPEKVSLQFNEPAVMMVHVVYKQENDGNFLYDSEKSMHMDKSFLNRISKLNGRPLYIIGPHEFIFYKAIR